MFVCVCVLYTGAVTPAGAFAAPPISTPSVDGSNLSSVIRGIRSIWFGKELAPSESEIISTLVSLLCIGYILRCRLLRYLHDRGLQACK